MRPPARLHKETWLLVLASALWACACGATPLPEPPAVDPGKIGFVAAHPVAHGAPLGLTGERGAAPPHATVRVTNLDSTANAVATTADAQGAFSLAVTAVPGDVLRFQAVLDEQRSAPVDLVLAESTGPQLNPSPRHDCVTLTPSFELTFDAPEIKGLLLHNDCSQPLTVANPRQRLALADFVLITALPLEVPPGASTTLSFEFSPSTAGEREDVVFFDLTRDGSVVRYPVTLFAR